MNNKGQIIITDLLLYIIVLTIILSLIIFTMVTINDNQVTRINNRELNNILEENFNTLIKTSGTPDNWEKLDSSNVKVVGLKSNNNHLISYDKLIKLKNNNHLLDKYLPEGVRYELSYYPKDEEENKVILAGNTLSYEKQVLSKSEVILFDYAYDIYSFNDDKNIENCYYNHDNNWTCKAFTISGHLLNEGKHYIITNSNTEYILSNTYSENISGTCKGIHNINNQLKQLIKKENETIYIHIKDVNNNTYLAYDKNNREEFLNTIIKPEIYIINMKIAI